MKAAATHTLPLPSAILECKCDGWNYSSHHIIVREDQENCSDIGSGTTSSLNQVLSSLFVFFFFLKLYFKKEVEFSAFAGECHHN